MLADSFEGKQFNAPNDAVVHPDDGAIWFTDPGCGSLVNYEGNRADTGASHYPDAPKNIKVWDVVNGNRLANGREFTSMEYEDNAGFADGIRADMDGITGCRGIPVVLTLIRKDPFHIGFHGLYFRFGGRLWPSIRGLVLVTDRSAAAIPAEGEVAVKVRSAAVIIRQALRGVGIFSPEGSEASILKLSEKFRF